MLLNALSENLLTLLAYDRERAPIIRGVIDPALFGGPYRDIAVRIYDYIDRFKTPPRDHLPDILSDKLDEKNQRIATLYTEIVESIHTAKEDINAEYVMSQLNTFVRRQSLRSVSVDIVKHLQRDTEEALDAAEALFASAGKQTLTVFDPGTRLSDKKRSLRFLDTAVAAFPTGIAELDKRGFGPTRKEMWLFIGNTKSGKTWGLIQLAKMATLQRLKVLHISLEMSEDRSAQRYFQALFALAKRKEKVPVAKLQLDDLGRISGYEVHKVTPALSMDDPKIRKKLERKIDTWAPRVLENIIIKQFPTGALTLGQLTAYLDNLELTERFVPDLLILDYPDLMKLDADNFRLAIDGLFKGLRGIAVARNLALAVVSQSHRGAAKAKQVGADNVAEAYSKIAHADTVVTYSQTESEKALGLARLHVAGGRNDQDKITIVITQQYAIGGFVMDSALQRGNYWGMLPEVGTNAEEIDTS